MAKCAMCLHTESQCSCCPPGPRRKGWIWVLPDGSLYLDRDIAAGIALVIVVALMATVALFGSW